MKIEIEIDDKIYDFAQKMNFFEDITIEEFLKQLFEKSLVAAVTSFEELGASLSPEATVEEKAKLAEVGLGVADRIVSKNESIS